MQGKAGQTDRRWGSFTSITLRSFCGPCSPELCLGFLSTVCFPLPFTPSARAGGAGLPGASSRELEQPDKALWSQAL